jgi:hypothetical protein
MSTAELEKLHTDQAWVDNLILTHLELQATRHVVFTTGLQVSVEVEGAHFEARAWRHAMDGRILPSHIDQYGVRRQLVVGAHCQVQIVEHPTSREAGGVNVVVAFVVGFVGLFLWGFAHGSRTPNGAWIAGVAIVGAFVLVLATGIAGYRRRERRDKARTDDVVPRLQQDTSGQHYWDAL